MQTRALPVLSSRRPGRVLLPSCDLSRRRLLAGGLTAAGAVLVGSAEQQRPTSGEATRTVNDAYGTVQVPARPERIVADSVSILAHLTALGVVPVGAAVPEDISPEYLGAEAAAVENVVSDDGWTIGVERALVLDPDLIVAVAADYNKENCDRYKAAMSTYCFDEGWKDAEHITSRYLVLGRALGRQQEAREAVTAYDAKVADVRGRIESSETAQHPVGVVRFDGAGFIGVRSSDVVNAVLASLGLSQPSWPTPGPSGNVELSLETLDVLNRADILMVTTDDNVDVEEMDVFASPLWKRLHAVRDRNAHFVGAWNGSDLIQLGLIVDTVAELVL